MAAGSGSGGRLGAGSGRGRGHHSGSSPERPRRSLHEKSDRGRRSRLGGIRRSSSSGGGPLGGGSGGRRGNTSTGSLPGATGQAGAGARGSAAAVVGDDRGGATASSAVASSGGGASSAGSFRAVDRAGELRRDHEVSHDVDERSSVREGSVLLAPRDDVLGKRNSPRFGYCAHSASTDAVFRSNPEAALMTRRSHPLERKIDEALQSPIGLPACHEKHATTRGGLKAYAVVLARSCHTLRP